MELATLALAAVVTGRGEGLRMGEAAPGLRKGCIAPTFSGAIGPRGWRERGERQRRAHATARSYAEGRRRCRLVHSTLLRKKLLEYVTGTGWRGCSGIIMRKISSKDEQEITLPEPFRTRGLGADGFRARAGGATAPCSS
jgi:hypothetical protein